MPHYFAYGSNLSSRQMLLRCPGASAIGPARLTDYELAFTRPSRRWGGYAADVVPAVGSLVWGVAWEVTPMHLQQLDRYEGVAIAAYRRRNVHVTLPDGGTLNAITYAVVDPQDGGRPSPRYLHTILEDAREHRLPGDWIRHLAALAP